MHIVAVSELAGYVGKDLEPSPWMKIDQQRINEFANATNDHQFIHVDQERASQTPLGSTIAHGYLTMALISYFLADCGVGPEGAVMVLNYGSDRVRYLQPVPVDSEVRGHAKLLSVTEKSPGQLLLKTAVTVQIRGQEKPALVAEILTLFVLR